MRAVGLMIRFEAGPEEIAGLMKFLSRRTEGRRLLLALLSDSPQLPTPDRKCRPRLTPTPLLRDLEHHSGARHWGMTLAPPNSDVALVAEADFLIHFFFSSPDAQGRRDIILEVQDELTGDPPYLSPRAQWARHLSLRAIRRLRRRGTRDGLRWSLPD